MSGGAPYFEALEFLDGITKMIDARIKRKCNFNYYVYATVREIYEDKATVKIYGNDVKNVPISTWEEIKVGDYVLVEIINADFSWMFISRKVPNFNS